MKIYPWSRFCLSALLLPTLAESSLHVRRIPTQDVAGAKRLPPSEIAGRDTKYVSCWNKHQSLTGSRLVRSPILASRDGLHRAYVEVEATAFEPKDAANYSGPLCENTSRLFLAGPDETKFNLAYSQSVNFSDGNSLELVDWSPEGTYLLMERTQWKYESEGDYTDFLLFNVNSGAVETDLSGILEARFGKDCSSENSAVGFTPEGSVVVAVSPVADTYYNDGATSCVKHRTLLALDIGRGSKESAQVLPRNFKVLHYGQFPERPAAKR
jgi:hypothetical protein